MSWLSRIYLKKANLARWMDTMEQLQGFLDHTKPKFRCIFLFPYSVYPDLVYIHPRELAFSLILSLIRCQWSLIWRSQQSTGHHLGFFVWAFWFSTCRWDNCFYHTFQSSVWCRCSRTRVDIHLVLFSQSDLYRPYSKQSKKKVGYFGFFPFLLSLSATSYRHFT